MSMGDGSFLPHHRSACRIRFFLTHRQGCLWCSLSTSSVQELCIHLPCRSSWPPSGPESALSLDKWDLCSLWVAVHIIATEHHGAGGGGGYPGIDRDIKKGDQLSLALCRERTNIWTRVPACECVERAQTLAGEMARGFSQA